MALGISSFKRTKKNVETVDPAVREQKIQTKIYKFANAIKIPAPVNQFKTTLEKTDEDRVMDLFAKYRPETREEKMNRLASADPRAGPKPVLIKFGMKHIVDLIERQKLKLVLIAADVTPITIVLALPTLCKKMGVAYAIVPSRERLGGLVHLKSAAAVGLEEVRGEDQAAFADITRMCNAVFADQYEKHMTVVGGGRINLKDSECLKKETFTN
ncbi:large subunit ribosomal protein L7Ae [Pancytospora philotis]|nr:large subunit ribosomal protein L7Ae [Pancytospora philotis]